MKHFQTRMQGFIGGCIYGAFKACIVSFLILFIALPKIDDITESLNNSTNKHLHNNLNFYIEYYKKEKDEYSVLSWIKRTTLDAIITELKRVQKGLHEDKITIPNINSNWIVMIVIIITIMTFFTLLSLTTIYAIIGYALAPLLGRWLLLIGGVWVVILLFSAYHFITVEIIEALQTAVAEQTMPSKGIPFRGPILF